MNHVNEINTNMGILKEEMLQVGSRVNELKETSDLMPKKLESMESKMEKLSTKTLDEIIEIGNQTIPKLINLADSDLKMAPIINSLKNMAPKFGDLEKNVTKISEKISQSTYAQKAWSNLPPPAVQVMVQHQLKKEDETREKNNEVRLLKI